MTAYTAEVEKLQSRAASLAKPSISQQPAEGTKQAAKENAERPPLRRPPRRGLNADFGPSWPEVGKGGKVNGTEKLRLRSRLLLRRKLVGRCTPADAQGYEQLMKSCGGNAARVLSEYAYFSPELRGILEKVAAVQAKESRTAGIFQSPRLSPWGDVQTSDTLCPGVFMVSTASHGGTMVALDMAGDPLSRRPEMRPENGRLSLL